MIRNMIILTLCFYSFQLQAQENAIDAIKNHLDEMGRTNAFSGVILIAQNDKIVFENAYGYANEGFKVENTTNTKFNLASMGKMFTAVAIMQLMEKGELKLNDKVGRFIPDYPNEKVKDRVTIHQLLTHTSGMGDYFNTKYEQKAKHLIRSLNDYLSFFESDSLVFDPGKGYRYSNAGYVLLGLIIENVTGSNYYDYVQMNVFKPADMTNTGWLSDEVVTNLAENYELSSKPNTWKKTFMGGAIGSSAGGGYSTVYDLFKFALALKSHKLITKNSLQTMIADQSNNSYGYGFSLVQIGNEKIFGHNGGAPGVAGELDIHNPSGYVVVTLSNRSPLLGWAEVRNFIRLKLAGSNDEIETFFNTKDVLDTYEKTGYDAAIQKLKSYRGKVKDRYIFEYGNRYRQQGDFDKAIDVIKILTEAFPDSWFPKSILADVYLDSGNKEMSKKYYQLSLTLNPENQWAIDRLAELNKN